MRTLEELVAELSEASRNIWIASVNDIMDDVMNDDQKEIVLDIAVLVDKLKDTM